MSIEKALEALDVLKNHPEIESSRFLSSYVMEAIEALEMPSVGLLETLSTLREWASGAAENKVMNKADLKFTLSNIALELLKIITAKPMVSVSKFDIASTLQRVQRGIGSDGDKIKALDPDAVIDSMTDAIFSLIQSKSRLS